jgi:hypothetical protein
VAKRGIHATCLIGGVKESSIFYYPLYKIVLFLFYCGDFVIKRRSWCEVRLEYVSKLLEKVLLDIFELARKKKKFNPSERGSITLPKRHPARICLQRFSIKYLF